MPKKMKILVVDDEIGIISFFYDFFVARNFEVLQATSGKAALEIYKEEKPKIILLDINLGKGMSGIDTLTELKKIDNNSKIIMMTGVKDEEITKEAMALGASDYITKPISLAYLDRVVILKILDQEIKDLAGND
ncbi:MAG: response regulator [Candidatus Omnitrophica bacterium]|nr:response regulator [Candidatus Omnitrophota bacterium]